MKKLVILGACLFSSIAYSSIESSTFSAKGLDKLKLKSMSGNVKVSLSEDGNAYVAANKVEFDGNCKLKIERSSNELEVEVKSRNHFKGANCKVNFDIKVPKQIDLDVKISSGNFDSQGTKGKIDFKIGSGDAVVKAESMKLEGKSGSGSINISGMIDTLDIKTGSGSIDVAGATGSTYLKSGSGDLKVQYKTAPQKGELDIKTGSGDATVHFPNGMKF